MELTEIPEGFKTLLPEEAERRADILSRMERVIKLWGYEPVLPPSVEFLLPFKAVDDALERLSFKIVDRKTGKLMAIRPDFTTQIARITASSFRNEEPPLRFYYRGSVFRDIDEDREFCQFGFELLGAVETEADAEVVAVVVNILEELGLKSFQIDIGHSLFLEGAVEELGVKEPERLLNLLSHRDMSGVETFAKEHRITGERRRKLLLLTELYGGEEILDTALSAFENDRSRTAVKQLKDIFSILKSYGFERRIIFDLSEKKGMSYHTGVTFEVFHPLLSFSIGAGGRYDQLMGRFGRNLPATGMAINVDALQRLLEKKGLPKRPPKDIYIIDLKKELHIAYEVARALREKGYTTARDIVRRSPEESVKLAFSRGFRYAVVLNRDREPRHVMFSPSGEQVELDPGNIVESILKHAGG